MAQLNDILKENQSIEFQLDIFKEDGNTSLFIEAENRGTGATYDIGTVDIDNIDYVMERIKDYILDTLKDIQEE